MNIRALTPVIVLVSLFIFGCSGKQTYRSDCSYQVDAAWQELEAAKAKGFAGTVSYTKAVGLISLAKSMQAVENFDNCVQHAKDARYYIGQSKQGQ